MKRSNKRSREEMLEDIVTSTAANLYDNWTDGHLDQSQSEWEKQALVHLKSYRPIELTPLLEGGDGWCVTIIGACPDYKRPSASTTVEHYRTEEEAISRVRNAKIQHLIDYDVLSSDALEDECITDEKLEELLEKLENDIYSECYMDMSLLDVSYKKIKF